MTPTATEQTTMTAIRGGEWLLGDVDPESVMTPEQLTEEHRLIEQTAAEFMQQEVVPRIAELEAKDWALNRELIAKCGALGLLGTNVPEEYGGVDLDKTAALIVAEQTSRYSSFCATFGAQANLTILPVLMFGTEDQKQRYLPGLVSGQLVGAYCLSETGSGTDSLAAKSRAMRQADDSFLLNGEKMWITNGGFADIFIVFAKVDGEQFTAFIVERTWPGVSSGKEEHKMGLHGSSTTPVLLQDVRVAAAQVLGEVGKGHRVAFNVLNFGRFKLGAMSSGAGRLVIAESAKYAASRKQFGTPIASFGAVKHKLGEMVARQYALESMMYRTAGLIDGWLSAPDSSRSTLQVLEEFAVEASIAKVLGSEVLDFIVDENVQIHGGNGFVQDYPAEAHYRDARVNRIFEGTNEINRLLIPGMLMKKALKGELPLMAAAKQLQNDLLSPSLGTLSTDDQGPLAAAIAAVTAFKKVALLLAGVSMQRFGDALQHEQEVLTLLADVLIDTYAAESAVLRAARLSGQNDDVADLHVTSAVTYVQGAAGRIEQAAKQCLAAVAEGDTLRTQLAALRRVLKVSPVNTVVLRRRLADATVARGDYPFAR